MGENNICIHQTHSMGIKYAKSAFAARIFGIFRAKGICLFAANVVLFLLNRI